jgi:hypothetical protein
MWKQRFVVTSLQCRFICDMAFTVLVLTLKVYRILHGLFLVDKQPCMLLENPTQVFSQQV